MLVSSTISWEFHFKTKKESQLSKVIIMQDKKCVKNSNENICSTEFIQYFYNYVTII